MNNLMERMYTYKYRLCPDKEQVIYLPKLFGCCGLVYNHFLNEKQTQYKETKSSDSYNVQQARLIQLRKKVDGFYPSSQLCINCGCKNKKVKNLSIRQWKCECCGSKHDRGVNAAINILRYNSVRNAEYSCGGGKQTKRNNLFNKRQFGLRKSHRQRSDY